MKFFITILLSIGPALFLCPLAITEEPPEYPVFQASDIKSIRAKEGQKITVTGTVSSVRKSKGGTHFLNFKDSEFYLITFKSDLQAFEDGEPADTYAGKNLAVTGVISLYKNKPQMKLSRPDMVKVIIANEPNPSPDEPSTKKSDKPVPTKPRSQSEISPDKVASDQSAGKKIKSKPPVDPNKYLQVNGS